MEYRAVGNRCAVDIGALSLPLSESRIITILLNNGFKAIDVNIISLARQCIGKSIYRRSARPSEAPGVMDCSSFMKWLYGERGIWLPRRTIQQRELGEVVVASKIIAGDLIFVSGKINYYLDNSLDGVGHVGIATGKGTVIHAANTKAGIIESPLEDFLGEDKFRGIRRYIPKNRRVITLETPAEREVETADDIKWIIVQSL